MFALILERANLCIFCSFISPPSKYLELNYLEYEIIIKLNCFFVNNLFIIIFLFLNKLKFGYTFINKDAFYNKKSVCLSTNLKLLIFLKALIDRHHISFVQLTNTIENGNIASILKI